MKKFYICFFVIFSFCNGVFFSSCCSWTGSASYVEESSLSGVLYPQKMNWVHLKNGISYTSFQNTIERFCYRIVKVNLMDEDIIIYGNDKSFFGRTVLNFVKESNSYIGINANPFVYPKGILHADRICKGLYVKNGIMLSKPKEGYAAIYFDTKKNAHIIENQIDYKEGSAVYAFGGFTLILDENGIREFPPIKDARMALGISNDGKTLYILSVEKNLFSTGLSYSDCAKIFVSLGVSKALQMDGGNSTNLIIADRDDLSVFSTRKVSTCMGIIVFE